MFLHASPALRATRVFTAVVTVWCLGCAGFEPVLDALLGQGASSTMSCGARSGGGDEAPAMDEMSERDGVRSTGATLSVSASGQQDSGCACDQTCQATSQPMPEVASFRDRLPHIAATDTRQPPSVMRPPLLRPPELTA